jgi:hypothetical protein
VIPLPVAIRYAYNVGITGEVNFYITGVVNFYSAGVVNFYSAGVVNFYSAGVVTRGRRIVFWNRSICTNFSSFSLGKNGVLFKTIL